MVAVSENTSRLGTYQAWLNETLAGYGEYVPSFKGFDITRSGLNNKQAYDLCNRLRDTIIYKMDHSKEEVPGSKHMHLTLSVNGGTSTVYDVENGGIYAIMSRSKDGKTFSYYGPERGLQMLGGRNEFQGIVQDFHDGAYDGGYFQPDGKIVR